MNKNKLKGSAIVMVIAVLSILVILATSLMQNRTKRAYFTRYMSNEKKAEVIAEAALDMAMAAIRTNNSEKANEPGHPIYNLIRTPVAFSGNFIQGGKNRIVTPGGGEVSIDSAGYKSAIQAMDSELGNIEKLEIIAKVSHAEVFGDSEQPDYKVVGINESFPYQPKNFPSPSASPANNTWRIPLIFPNGSDIDYEKTIEVNLDFKGTVAGIAGGILGDEVDVLLKLARITNVPSKSKFKFEIEVDEDFLDKANDLIDLYNAIPFVDNVDNITNESLNEMITELLEDDEIDIEEKLLELEQFSGLDEFSISGLQRYIMGSNPSLSSYVEPTNRTYGEIVEKGGILQLKCNVIYSPSKGSITGKVEKTMVAEVPFKLADVQPIASEYTFFIANSPYLDETGAASTGGALVLDGSDTLAAAADFTAINNELVIHNIPGMGMAESSKPAYGKPGYVGRLRINGNPEPINTFVGCMNNIKYTELNTMCTPDISIGGKKLKVRATFGVTPETDPNNPGKDIKINFPILFVDPPVSVEAATGGITGIYKMYKSPSGIGDMFTMPTLLHGYGHMEYPIGRKIEANLLAKVSEMYGVLEPDITIEIDFDEDEKFKPIDESVTYYSVKNKTVTLDGEDIAYGMPEIDSSTENTWTDVNSAKNMPPNCYTTTQYMKKACKFFDSESQFKSQFSVAYDKGGFSDSGNIRIEGVVFVKGDLTLQGNTFSGNGLIVTDGNVTISGDIKVAGNENSLGIIARRKQIKSSNTKIQASLFSNLSPIFTDVFIKGNLVVNEFNRDDFKRVHIIYDSNVTSVSDATLATSSGTAEPKRFHASFADNWSRTYYEKK
ncbi:MAG: hypothetical protein BWY02_00259 [bacterium ADurb.Bin157]|nr:MAG: hypothetical protein BWY02_00259 [bacterium ADurb.Bin157]